MARKHPPKSKPESGLSVSGRALRLLARRDHTRRELETKLGPYVEDPSELQGLLDDFTARGWLSESRVVDQVVNAKRAGMGPARIRHTLLKRGVSEDLIAPALVALKETELDTARALRTRKFGAPAATLTEQSRQVRFLQARGFSLGVAMRVVRTRSDPADD